MRRNGGYSDQANGICEDKNFIFFIFAYNFLVPQLLLTNYTKLKRIHHTWAWDFFHGGGSAEFWKGGQFCLAKKEGKGVGNFFFCEKLPKFTGFL